MYKWRIVFRVSELGVYGVRGVYLVNADDVSSAIHAFTCSYNANFGVMKLPTITTVERVDSSAGVGDL